MKTFLVLVAILLVVVAIASGVWIAVGLAVLGWILCQIIQAIIDL